MYRFFIRRPIVAIVIAIVMVIVGLVAMAGLPVAQYPNIIPPEILAQAFYVGADALTVEQSVATPLEQKMSGVDNMNYMYSLNANNGQMQLTVNFDVKTDPNTDQILTQQRESQAESQFPPEVRNYGVTVQKSLTTPLMLFALYSPEGSHDETFLANYAYINIVDQLTRVRGIARVTVFGAGQYALRCWVHPDRLAKLNITVPEIIDALQKQNTVNPAGQIAGEPSPRGQEFTYAIQAQGRLVTPEEFGRIVLRANPDGSLVRLSDVASLELGAQTYNIEGRFKGKPTAILALFQLPGTNALEAATGAKKVMAKIKESFPGDLDYDIALDTTLSVTEGIKEIVETLFISIFLVIIVVFVFLQGWRATLIPIIAVPVSLIGTFAFFPVLNFSINPIALMGLVVAIGLVVDDAIVVVEAVQHHIENGMAPKEAALKAMEEVAGPVMAIALVLAAVFLPTVFIPGITGRLYTQFAVTIAISVILSAFNALTLSPALCSIFLRPKKEAKGPLNSFYNWFNRMLGRGTEGYVSVSGGIIRKAIIGFVILAVMSVGIVLLGKKIPGGFLPEEDLGYVFAVIQLPNAASLQRTSEAGRQVEQIIMNTPGVENCTTVIGFNLLSLIQNTYSGFFFIKLKDWSERKSNEEKAPAIIAHLNRELSQLPQGIALAFPPPAIQGIGTAGGVTFILEDRAGRDIGFLAENTRKFMEAAQKRPELAQVFTTLLADVPRYFVDVDRDKVLSQGVDLGQVYGTLQAFMGGQFVNYFNRFGRQWQVYVEAEGDYRTDVKYLNQFYVKNSNGDPVPLSAVTRTERRSGPEFTMRYNLYRSAQINAAAAPGYSTLQAMNAMEEVFKENHAFRYGLRLHGHVIPGASGTARHLARCSICALNSIRLSHTRRALRELVAALQCPAQHAHCGVRSVCGTFGPRNGFQRLRADRVDSLHRTGCEKCHTDRRIRKKRVRGGQRTDGRDTFRSKAEAPSDSDDVLRVYSRLCSTGHCQWSWRLGQTGDGDGRYRWHARCNRDCDLPHPDVVLRHRKTQQSEGEERVGRK